MKMIIVCVVGDSEQRGHEWRERIWREEKVVFLGYVEFLNEDFTWD